VVVASENIVNTGKPVTARQLNRRLGYIVPERIGGLYYHVDGDWYEILTQFPGALFDAHGYVIFENEDDFRRRSEIQIGRTIHVIGGISNLPGYQLM
jgi:hypothetical protein